MREQATGHAGKRCADCEGDNLVFGGIHSHCFRSDLIFTNRDTGAPMTGVDEVLDKQDRNHHQEERPGKRGIARNPH